MKNKKGFIINFMTRHFLQPYTETVLITAYNYNLLKKRALVRALNLNEYGTMTCEICKKPLNYGKRKRLGTIDHKLPKSKGGTAKLQNLQVAHKNII